MRTFKFIFVLILPFLLFGCNDEQSPFIVESAVDLQNPNGIYEILLYKGSNEALSKIDFQRFKNKNIYFELQGITDGYLEGVAYNTARQEIIRSEGNILTINNTEENKDKSEEEIKKEIDYDFDVYITLPISGVYYYEGFFKRNYYSYVMINLIELDKNGSSKIQSSGIIKKQFDQFIPSKNLVISFWVLIISIFLSLLFKRPKN